MAASAAVLERVEYRPADREPLMGEREQIYFRGKLLRWKDDRLREWRETVAHLQRETENHPDLVDRASSETDLSLGLRTRDRRRKLIAKIDAALRRLEEGACGWRPRNATNVATFVEKLKGLLALNDALGGVKSG